jgi:hypothetical protein
MAEYANAAAERADNRGRQVNNELKGINDKMLRGKETAKKEFLLGIKNANAGADPENDKLDAARAYKQSLQDIQNEYELNINTVTGKPLDHNAWADNLDETKDFPEARAAPTPAAGQPAPPTRQTPQGTRGDPAGIRAKKPDPLGIR